MEVERSSVRNNSGKEGELGGAGEEDKPVHALRLEIAIVIIKTFIIVIIIADNKLVPLVSGWRDFS